MPFKRLTQAEEAARTIFNVFGVTQPGFEPPNTQTQSGRFNHYATESGFQQHGIYSLSMQMPLGSVLATWSQISARILEEDPEDERISSAL